MLFKLAAVLLTGNYAHIFHTLIYLNISRSMPQKQIISIFLNLLLNQMMINREIRQM